MLQETKRHPWLRRAVVLLLAFVIVATYMPHEALQAYAATKASVYDGRTLKGSDGKSYYPNQKGGGYYYAKFSNKAGDGFVYRLARATSAKKTIVVDSGKGTYQGYCLEHGAWMNAGATGYSAEEQSDLLKLRWMKPYSDSTMEGIRLALLFGKQPGMTEKDVPVAGCNLDDWYWATQNIIWEFQQGLRTSVDSGLKTRTGKYEMNANWFRDTVKGRPAEKIYNWMLNQMKKYKKLPSFTVKYEDQIKANQIIAMEKQDNGTWVGKATDKKGIGHNIKSTNKHVKIKRSGDTYTITCDVDPATITKPIKAVKNLDVSAPKKELLAWTTNQKSPVADSNHLQSVVTGADDPVEMYFKLSTGTPAPQPGNPGTPELPSFELDVEKFDKNPGFDQDSDVSHTGIGDAALDATIDLIVGGEVYDSKTLDVNGYSDEPFYFMPWDDVSELDKTEVPTYDEKTGDLLYTDYYWRGNKTVKTVESGVPDGRFPDENGGERDHGTITYYAHCRDDGPMDYNITYENGALTDVADISPDNPQAMIDDKDGRAYVNDNFRGQLQIVKTKTDLDPFTPNNGSGKLDYSTASKWTIKLDSEGYEGCPYIRVVPLQPGEPGYIAFANNYKVVRDNSGTPADKDNPLTVSQYGQINVVDLPYGNYTVEEISADSNGYVLESHQISVTTDGQLISTDTDNVPKKNKVQVVKVNSETGKTVRLNENSSFRIKYLGNPDLPDPTQSTNYGKYLPNGSDYNDGGESGKNNYIFKCNSDGQIVLPYQLEYGIYQLEEVTVPEGYFVGAYDDKGTGTSTDMPKKFEDAVVIYDAAGKKVTDFTNNEKVIFNKYKFEVSHQTPHQDGKDYVTYYLTVKMPNNPVKGKIEITKNGESLAGWLQQNYGGNSGFAAVWDKTKLKDATFNVYAAEDVYQADAVQRIRAFDSKSDEEIELEEVTRDHADKDGAKSFWQKLLDTGEKLLRWIGIDIGDDNECKTEYIAKADKGATYSTKYAVTENGITTVYDVEYSMSYTKGGMNYTNIHVKKDMTADSYVPSLDVTEPKLTSGGEEIDILNLILPNKNMVRLNKETVNEYGKDDITAKIVMPVTVVNPMELDEDPQAPDGWTLEKKAGKYLATKEVQEENEDGTPKVDETTGDPVMKTLYQIYVDDNGDKKWIDCEADGKFEDANTPKDLPDGFAKTDKAEMYQVSRTDDTGTAYKVWTSEGWASCDADGKFYKSHHQEYDITLSQHFDCADGWIFSFDGLIVDALADNQAQTAKTLVTNPWGTTPQITASSAYTHETKDGITTFDAAPTDLAPVYFKVNNGIKTSMIYQGGQTVTTMIVKQSQLYYFGEDSKPEDTTSTEKIYPTVEYTNTEETELIEWCKDLTPDNTAFERVFDENNFVKVNRHEVSGDNKDEVYYEITMVSDNKAENKGFKVTYPDTTTMQPVIGTDEGKDAGKLIFTSVEGTMMHPMGSPVATITTDENGIATTPNLPLGKYYIQEVTSGHGHVNNGQWKEFNLTYKDQYTPLIWDEATMDNEAVSVKIDLQKLLETAYGSKDYQPGGGAVFGVFSAEKITAKTKTDKKVDKKTIEADTLVGTITVQGDGTGTTVAKLPLGRYYVKEISAPANYKLNGTKYYFDATDILTADQATFKYKDIGVSGRLTQDGSGNTVLTMESLYSKPMNKVTINGTEYDMLTDVATDNLQISVLDGRTKTKLTIPAGTSGEVRLANGAVIKVDATKTAYTAVFEGTAPALDLGSETNLTKTTEGNKTTVTYSPKVTTTNFLGEMTFNYVAPKPEDQLTEADKAKTTIFNLASPKDSAVKAVVNYNYGKADLTFTGSKVTSMTLDGEPIADADKLTNYTLQRIITTLVGEGDDQKEVTEIKAATLVVNFEDGVSYTISFDDGGNFAMSDSGIVDGDIEKDSTLETDGDTGIAGPVRFKTTTAKTYARNNTNAGVLNISINSIQNDRLPDTPTPPPGPNPSSPNIGTTATDSVTKDHIAKADSKVTIVDKVAYHNLVPGKEYMLKGTLMDKSTGKELLIGGKKVTAEAKFKPEKSDGTINMEFTFDGSSLKGKDVVVFEELYVMADTDNNPQTPDEEKKVTEHKDINDDGQTVHFPEIGTTAVDSDTKDHVANADGKVTIIDTVKYTHLIPGKEYTVSGVLMDKATGKAILVDGKKVTASKTFTPDKADGSIELEFTFDAAALAGTTIVVFETLKYDGKEVAVHKDIKDKDQTVYIPEIKTSAAQTAKGTITDIVKYTNLQPGKEYTLKGTLMDKATGKPIRIKGEEVIAQKIFIPTSSNGSVKVTFTFDADAIAGKTTVVFEDLYLKGKLVAKHKDLNDKDQTVKIDEKIGTVDVETNITPGSGDDGNVGLTPQTGDTTLIWPYIALLIIALGVITLLIAKRKNRQNKENK